MGLRMLPAVGVRLVLAAALTSQLSAQVFDRQCPDANMPFDLVSNFEVVVQGRIGGLDGLRFIVDTGSSHSVIDRRVADKLGLDRQRRNILNFDRDLAVDWADVPEVRIGPIRVAGIGMIVTGLAEVSDFARDADGIIGMDVLSRTRKMCIDYERRTISFEFDGGRNSERPVMKSFVVPVVIQGTPVHLLVDTGLQYMVLYKDRLQSALPHLRVEGEPRDTAIGHLQVTEVNLPGVQIFDRKAATPVLLIEEHDKAGLDGLDGYLGAAFLHARRIELDFAAKVLRWQ